MKLEPGSRLAHYEVVELIGKGGMGEVYRAKDTRLPREVAIKTSSERFSERFAREAKVIASLNHPNICTLFDVGPDYLVMELVEGPTLYDRIKEGPLALKQASAIGQQVADALEYAHEKGVIHRDLKPGNIKIRPDGVLKVLDFGLAKVAPAAAGPTGEGETVTLGGTEVGVVLGTAAYMSPEQAMGKAVDRRADVFSFGVVFYEMLTGTRLHRGDSTQEILASVMKDEPDLSKVPPQAHRLLKRCLEKDPNHRLRHVGDVMALLDDASVSGQVAPVPAPAVRRTWLWPALAAAAIVIAAVAIWAPWRSGVAPEHASRFEVAPSGGMTFNAGAYMTLSPDGRWMVFQANGDDGITRFWVRSISGVDLRPLPGTENIGQVSPPAAWSYDSRWVVFSPANEGKLKKVDIQGGPPQPIADWPGGLNGASWNAEGIIIGGSSRGGVPILKVAAAGGQATPATALAPDETNHLWPQFLPDGKHFLYERVSGDPNKAGVYIGSIDVKPEEQSTDRLLPSDRQAYYAALPGSNTGQLVFMRGSTLMAQPFDPSGMKLSGEAGAIADQVDSFPPRNGGLFSVSNTGTLAYRTGSGPQSTLTWFDAQGKPGAAIGEPGFYANPAISPDGNRVAVAVGNSPAQRDIWIVDAIRGNSTRFTFDPNRDDFPTWRDDKTLAFAAFRNNQLDIYSGPADSPGQEKLVLHTEEPKDELHWTKGGLFLVFSSLSPKTARDIWALPIEGEAKPVSLVQTQFVERLPSVSPNGRWLAYTSSESGGPEVWVRPFTTDPGGSAPPRWMISKGGGLRPKWRSDGKMLYYYTLGSQMIGVDVDGSTTFQYGTPRALFTGPPLGTQQGWDIARDGRFLFISQPNSGRVIPFTVVEHWASELKK